MAYDVLIKGGHAVDSAAGFNGPVDIGVREGKIVDVSTDPNPSGAATVIDAKGMIVTPGLIDFHAHAMFLSGIGLETDLDRVCQSTGVTTLVDGGSSGAATFPTFKAYMIDRSATRLRAFLHISSIGLADLETGESSYLDLHDPARAAGTAKAFPELIVGIKVRLQAEVVGDKGLEPLRLAKQAAAQAGGLPTMVHVTHPPVPLREILVMLDPGDVVSHFMHGKPRGILNERGDLDEIVIEARRRGILFDVGHGRNHVDFNVARTAIDAGFLPDTISTDLTRGGMRGVVKDLPHTLSKFLNLGMDLAAVVACATTHPARLLGMAGTIGTLQPAAVADIAVFELGSGEFTFEDTEGNHLKGQTRLVPRYTLSSGSVVWSSS